MPIFMKNGCNNGSCHGAARGKDGFHLSLFGYDPAVDEENLVRGGLNRRIDLADPHGSLLLKKPLMRLGHVGGKKLAPADAAYEVLRRWIAEGAQTADKGAPECTGIRVHPSGARVLKAPWLGQQVSVVATFADGSTRDFTAIATYETSHKDVVSVDPRGRASGLKAGQAAVSVRYLSHLESVHFTVVEDVPGFRWPDPPAANFVDELVHRKLRQLQVPPSGLCDDGAFLRRIHLDLTGLLPSAEAVRAFLRDTTPGKRMRVIDSLLASEEFARYWGQRAADLMRVNAKGLPGGRAEIFAGFITDSLRRNMPFDKFATAILTATGDGTEVPEANYFLAIDKLSDLTETTAQLFMGSRINCAKCHNHPFENWTQDDYYRISAVFARVRNENGAVGLSESGETRHPVNGRAMPPFAAPKAGLPVARDRRADFARWLTAPGNPYFARVEANRAWAALFGRGIVDPIDDFRSSNPPSNPELLDGLAAFLERSGYDRRALIRAICASNTYQASAVPLPLNRHDDSLFSHARVRRLSAEQLQDAVGLATGQLRPAAEIGSDIADSLNKEADDFRNKKLFDFGFNDPTRVEIGGKAYDKQGENWVSGADKFDAGTIQTVIDKLRDLSASKFTDKTGGTDLQTASVTYTEKKKVEKVTIRKAGEDYYAVREADPATYIIDKAAFDDLQKAVTGIKVAAPPAPAGKGAAKK